MRAKRLAMALPQLPQPKIPIFTEPTSDLVFSAFFQANQIVFMANKAHKPHGENRPAIVADASVFYKHGRTAQAEKGQGPDAHVFGDHRCDDAGYGRQAAPERLEGRPGAERCGNAFAAAKTQIKGKVVAQNDEKGGEEPYGFVQHGRK